MTLKKKNIEDILALTPMQEGMLFHYLKNPEKDVYFVQLSLRIPGTVKINFFEQAWNAVIKTNDMLRAVFQWEKKENPVQIILKEHKLQPRYYDFSAKEPGGEKKRLEDLKSKDREERFDLRKPPFRISLCRIEKALYEMIITNYHILYDGWSTGIILKEFFNAYEALTNGEELVKPIKTKFKEFINWNQKQNLQKQKKFWNSYLSGGIPQTGLSIKEKRSKGVTSPGNYRLRFETALTNRLKDFVKKLKITLASFLYSAWGLLLQKYNNHEDVIFGTTLSGRSAKIPGIEDIVGLFINTLPLIIQNHPHETIGDLLCQVDRDLLLRQEFESTSLVNIKKWSDINHKEELFDTIVVIENYPLERQLKKLRKGELFVDSYSTVEMTHYDLTVAISLMQHLEVDFSYNKERLDKETIKTLARHFKMIIQYMASRFDKKISEIDMLSPEERRQLLDDFGTNETGYPQNQTIVGLFETQVEKTPNRAACFEKGNFLTFKELNNRADYLAEIIKERGGKGKNHYISIMLNDGFQLIIGLLAILKSGNCFVPLDPEFPNNRINFIINDLRIKTLLTDKPNHKKAGQVAQDNPFLEYVIGIDDINLENTNKPKKNQSSIVPDSPCYLIYTSGSTGKPKGVQITHGNLSPLLAWIRDYFKIAETIRVLQNLSYTFDFGIFEIFTPMIMGGTLYFFNRKELIDLSDYVDFIHLHKINALHTTPSLFSNLLSSLSPGKRLSSLKILHFGGEQLTKSLLIEVSKQVPGNCTIHNGYGPTEVSISTSIFSLAIAGENCLDGIPGNVPIGKPSANNIIYILNRYNSLLPVGVPGEIYIGGDGVSPGYLNRQELTHEKFIPDPYRPGLPMYRTGDRGCWLRDGNLQFLGRLDKQVKIRGLRIELEEIERRLANHPMIKEAVVMLKEGIKTSPGYEHDNKYICAYYVSKQTLKVSTIKEYLAGNLPAYMIPSYFLQLETIPLTPNGKVNHQAIPSPPVGEETGRYITPGDHTEKTLVEIWSDILGIEPGLIGIDANFFQLGGHSLKAMALVSKIHKTFNVKMPLTNLFETPVIRQMAGYIKEVSKEQFAAIKLAAKKDYYELSSAQKRLYFLHQVEKKSTGYNMPFIAKIVGNLDKEKLENTFRLLVKRHESLRTSFVMEGDKPKQKIHEWEEVKFEIEYYDLQVTGASDRCRREEAPFGQINAFGGGEREPATALISSFVHPFDLSRAPLMRSGLIQLPDGNFTWMVDMHHIISDGVSHGILVRDFMYLFEGKELPPLRIQYRDFSEWQNNFLKSEQIKKQEAYWLGEFNGGIPVLNLPTDYVRPRELSFAGKRLMFEIGIDETRALKQLAAREDATLFMVLLAIYYVLLNKLSGQEEIVVGTPTAGRRHADLQSIIGMFVNTLALKNRPQGAITFKEFLTEVRKKTLEAFENQDYQFEELVEKVASTRDMSRNPIFDAMLLLQNMDSSEIEIPGLKLKFYDYKNLTAKFDLNFCGREIEGKLIFTAEYNTKLFKEETIARFILYFNNMVSAVIENSEKKLSEIKRFTGENRKKNINPNGK